MSTVSESGLAPWLHTGEGTLAHYRGVTMLVGPGDELVTGQLLAAARATAGTEQPDHQLRQIAARLVAANGSAPAICAVGEVEGGVAALVHGAARVTVRTDLGALSLAGCPHRAVVDGFLAGRICAVEAELGDAEPTELPLAELPLAELPLVETVNPAPLSPAEEPVEMPTVADVVAAVADVVAAVEEALTGAPAERSVVLEPIAVDEPVPEPSLGSLGSQGSLAESGVPVRRGVGGGRGGRRGQPDHRRDPGRGYRDQRGALP